MNNSEQLSLFQTQTIPGFVTGKPVPQEKSVLYPLIAFPDHESVYPNFWRVKLNNGAEWEISVIRCIGYGNFNGVELIYGVLPDGQIQEFGKFSLFPPKENEILQSWGMEGLKSYQNRISNRHKK